MITKIEKPCTKCGETKELKQFDLDKRNKSGYAGRCIACRKLYRLNNLDKISAQMKLYHIENKKEKNEKCREYYDNNREKLKGKMRNYSKSRDFLDTAKEHKSKYPKRTIARQKVRTSIRNGGLIRPDNCSECKLETKPQAHHDNYNKPLAVRWLCRDCHGLWHRNNEAIN